MSVVLEKDADVRRRIVAFLRQTADELEQGRCDPIHFSIKREVIPIHVEGARAQEWKACDEGVITFKQKRL